MSASAPQRFRAAVKYLRGSRAAAARLQIHEDLRELPWSRVTLIIVRTA